MTVLLAMHRRQWLRCAFHVKLFAQAKTTEQLVQDILDPRAAREAVERRAREPQMFGKQDDIACLGCGNHRFLCFRKVRGLPAIERDRIFSGEHGACEPLNLDGEFGEPFPRFGRQTQ